MKTFAVRISYLWRILWHPIDSIFDIVYKGKGSIISACLIYLLYMAALVMQPLLTNFIFNPYGLHGMSIPRLFISFLLPIFVLVIANCLIGSIRGGQGTYRAVFIASAYALAPFVIFSVPLALFSNVLSGAEESIYKALLWFLIAWTGFYMYLTIMEVHGFGIIEAFVNTIWMVFTGAILVLFVLAFFGITYQSANFLYEFLLEAIGYV